MQSRASLKRGTSVVSTPRPGLDKIGTRKRRSVSLAHRKREIDILMGRKVRLHIHGYMQRNLWLVICPPPPTKFQPRSCSGGSLTTSYGHEGGPNGLLGEERRFNRGKRKVTFGMYRN